MTFLPAARLFERPAIGRDLRAMEASPVEEQRANVASFSVRLRSSPRAGTVAVFPQGGIDRDEIQGGAAYLALKANAALLPLHLAGTRKALPPDGKRPCLARITVRVGVPVPGNEIANGHSSTSAAVRLEGTVRIGRPLAETGPA